MTNATILKDLFDRWERVWHEGAFDLVEACVAPHYVRHDEMGDRTVAREDYAAELSRLREARPDIRIIVYDHSFDGDRAWYRFTMRWTDLESDEVRTRAGLQSYRTEGGAGWRKPGSPCSRSARPGTIRLRKRVGRFARRAADSAPLGAMGRGRHRGRGQSRLTAP